MSTQTATQPGAVKITLHSANNDVDEKAEVTVALKHPEEAVAKMLRTLAQRFPPESVMTIQPAAAPSMGRAEYFSGLAAASGDHLNHGAASDAIHKNRDDSPLTQASSANGSRRNTPSRSKDSGPRIPPMGYNYPPNPIYSTSHDGSQRKGSQRTGRHHAGGAVMDPAMIGPPSPTHMDHAGGAMYPGMPFGPMYGPPGVANSAEAYAHGHMGGWPMMPPPNVYPAFGYPLMAPMPGSPMVDANGKIVPGHWPYPGYPMPAYCGSPAAAATHSASGYVGDAGDAAMAAGSNQYVVETETRGSAGGTRITGGETSGQVIGNNSGMPRPNVGPQYTISPGSQTSQMQNRPFDQMGRGSDMQRSGEFEQRFDNSRPSLGPQGTSDILNTLQPGFGEYCHVGPDGLRTRYVEVEVFEEREVRVPKVEVREVTREEKEVKYETVVREVEEVEYVDEVIETERVVEEEREIKVPVKRVKEVPVEHVITKTIDIVDERVEVIEKPEIVEVEKFYNVEQPVPVPRYHQKDVPCMVAQKLRPCVRTEGKMKVATTTYEPVLYAVEVYIPKPVPNAIIPNGKIDETHQRVDIPAAQYNSLVHRLNVTLDKQVVNEVCLKTVEGHVPLLPAGELAEIIPPIPGAWADERAIMVRDRGGNYNSSGPFITKEKQHKKSHRKHRHHKN